MYFRSTITTTFFISLLFFSFKSHAETDKNSLFDLSLEESMEINITIATGIKQSLAKAPATASVITAQQIKEMGATSLDEVLETVPGLHISRSAISLDSIYSIRGIQNERGSHVQLLLNGISLSTPFLSARENGFHFPLESVKQIEVIRGPGSAVYGADAFAGVINIITKDGSDINGTEIGGRVGSFDTQDAWLQHGGNYFDWDVAFSFQYQHSHGDSGRKVTRDLQTAFDSAFGTNASLAPGSLNTGFELFDIHLGLQEKQWDINLWTSITRNAETGGGVGQALDPTGSLDSDQYLIDIGYENKDLVDDWQLNANLSYLYNQFEAPLTLFPSGATLPIGSDGNIDFNTPNGLVTFSEGFLGIPGRDQQVATVSLSSIYSGWSSHRIRISAEFKYEDLVSNDHRNFGPGIIDGTVPIVNGMLTNVTGTPRVYVKDTHRTIWAGSIQDEWSFTEDWHLTAGVRYDYYSDFGSTVNPRVALVWEPLTSLTTKLLYGSAFRAPSFEELGNINNPVSLGNPNLDPETINTFEWGVDYHPTSNFRTALNVFYYEIEDLIGGVQDSGATTVTSQNVQDQIGYGFEWDFSWQTTEHLKFKGNYAWQHSEDKKTQRVVENRPRQQVYFASDWQFLPNWNLHGQFNWVGKKKRVQGDTRSGIEDTMIVDLLLNRSSILGHLDISFAVKNVFNEQGYQPSPTTFPDDFPNQGRSFYVETRLNF